MPNADESYLHIDEIKTALPKTSSLQEASLLMACAVCEAYAAYNNGSNNEPAFHGALSDFTLVETIYVPEADPNGNPFSALEATVKANAVGREAIDLPTVNSASISTATPAAPACATSSPGTPGPGKQLFGFTATDGKTYNILALRGTVTLEEAAYDLYSWGTNTPCILPVGGTTSYGNVNAALYKFYADGLLDYWSLSQWCQDAIKNATQANPDLPWLVASHSLGGAMVSLAALEAKVTGAFGNSPVFVMTFGSLHVGDLAFARKYMQQLPYTVRVANLCDFVPSMVSIQPGSPPQDGYVHVGSLASFAWQTWDDWANHSLSGMYLPVIANYWSSIFWGPLVFPLPYGRS